jgi:FMN phosphatase YigB (HAD superfamily)
LERGRYKAFLFDVDGTLYDQPMVRKKMALELVRFLLVRPARFRDVLILRAFRRLREKCRDEQNCCLEEAQYQWTAEKLGLDAVRVRAVVKEWIFERPLKHLPECRPPGLAELFARLRENGIKIGVFSDYPAAEKLAALGLRADVIACATDEAVNRFKPHSAGLEFLCRELGVSAGDCIHIGDRLELDGVCSERCGCDNIILPAHRAKTMGRAASYDVLFSV